MVSSDTLQLRAMVIDDLLNAHALSQSVGWGHRLEDWQLLFSTGKGQIAVRADGTVVGVALWWPYGTDYATIGMVIVSPEMRGAGVGRRLMDSILSAAGGRRLLLNATAGAVRLYERLEFSATGRISTHSGIVPTEVSPRIWAGSVRDLQRSDWPAILSIDLQASGMERQVLLDALKSVSVGLVLETGGHVSGYLLRRKFARGTLIGPLVADTERGALKLLSTAIAQTGGALRVDIPDDAPLLARWLEGAGLSRTGQVTTMWRPGPLALRRGPRIYGLAAQALG